MTVVSAPYDFISCYLTRAPQHTRERPAGDRVHQISGKDYIVYRRTRFPHRDGGYRLCTGSKLYIIVLQ